MIPRLAGKKSNNNHGVIYSTLFGQEFYGCRCFTRWNNNTPGKGFVISGVGQAMESGRVGDLIRVRNIDSKRIIIVRIAGDGTGTPLLAANKR